MKTLYVAWQNPDNRSWFPVGKLTFDGQVYQFSYTRGAKKSSNFTCFGLMTDFNVVYESVDLFPLFSNRLIPESRPEYREFVDWLALQRNEADPIALLGRSEGVRGTDSLTVFPHPEKDEKGEFRLHFFSHGIRYFGDQAVQRVNTLNPDDPLYLMTDPQNQHDRWAIALRTDDPATVVGYCPRYLTEDFHVALNLEQTTTRVSVERVNHNAPIQFRLLCCLSAKWPNGFEPCSSELYQPITRDDK